MINIYKKLLKIFNERYINNYKEFHKYFKELEMNEHIKTYINNSYFVRGSLFKTLKKFNPNPYEIDILMDSKKTNLNYKDIFNEYQFNEKAFLFLDPPYLFSDNSGYKPQINKNDMTLIIVDILDLLKNSKCKIMLIINKLDILVYLFKDYIKGEYERIYQLSKKKSGSFDNNKLLIVKCNISTFLYIKNEWFSFFYFYFRFLNLFRLLHGFIFLFSYSLCFIWFIVYNFIHCLLY